MSRVRIKKTDITGTVTRRYTDRCMVRLDGYDDVQIMLYSNEIEHFVIANPCVVCGEETPEGTMACRACVSKIVEGSNNGRAR